MSIISSDLALLFICSLIPNIYNLSGHKDHESEGLIEEFQTIVADSTGGL